MPESFELSSLERLAPTRAPRLLVGRRVWRVAQIAGWTATWGTVWSLGALVTLALHGHRRRWRSYCFQGWSLGVLRILRIRVTFEGHPPTKGPFVLATNHLSYLDVMVLASVVPAVFVAKSEVRGWPVWGILARAMGTIFVDRSRARDTRRVGAAIATELEQGGGVVVFPEGTSSPGYEVGRFRSSLLDAAVRTGTPVHYAALSYATAPDDPPAHLSVCWWGDMTFAPHFWQLTGLDRIDALVRFGARSVSGSDRKTLARALQQAVADHFTPVVSKELDDRAY